MNKPNDRVIRAIVACGSFVVLLVIGYPLVDEGRRLREDNLAFTQLEDELDKTQSRDARLHRIESKLEEQKRNLLLRSVTRQRIPEVRDELIAMIRDCGGSLRSLEIEDGQKRRWAVQEDDPRSRRPPEFGTESEFELHSYPLSLSVVGPLEAVLKIVEKVNGHHWLMSIEMLDLKPAAGGDSVVGLEMNITLFGLLHAPLAPDDTFAMTVPL